MELSDSESFSTIF